MASDVSFTRTTWVSGSAPGISAAELNRLEQIAVDLSTQFNAHNGGAAASDHPEATGSVRGFMSAADKTKLNAVEVLPYADSDPLTVFSVASPGTSDAPAREDHRHAIEDAERMVIVTGSEHLNSATGLGSGYTSKATVSVAMPAAWQEARIMVMGSAHYVVDAVAGNVALDACININGFRYDSAISGQGADGEELVVNCVGGPLTYGVGASPINVSVDVRWNNASGSVGKYTNLAYWLVRSA